MHLVTHPEPGVLDINFAWLPAFIGMNSATLAAINSQVLVPFCERNVNKPLDEELLNALDREIITWLQTNYATMTGLSDYLDALKYVSF